MSDGQKIDLPVAEEPAQLSRKDAIKGSLNAVQETLKLLRTGHFAGARAHKVVGCIAYLSALEEQIRAQVDLEK